MTARAELLVELRFEELPASMIRPCLQALADGVVGLLDGVEHGGVTTYATPRRFAVVVADVAVGKPEVEVTVTGPPADRAFDADGNPTKAAIGFAAGRGVHPSALTVVELPKRGKVVAAVVREGGEKTAELLSVGLDAVVRGLPFQKSMEWGTGGVRFGRPLHGVSVVFDGKVVPGAVAGLAIDNQTEGHWLHDDPVFRFASAAQWYGGLRERKVEADLSVRKARVRAILDAAAAELGADPIDQPALLEEVTHLVEWPVQVLGTFDASLLALPARLLVTAMKVHQRYFPIFRHGELTNRFVVISNNPWGDHDLIAEGNARVLRARFHDARFFFAEDKKKRLEAHGEQLARMRWIRGLGTMADKQERIAGLAGKLALELFHVARGRETLAIRAGLISKCDLSTQMVGEFPELQGHMGRLYAIAQGEPDDVARAIEEHYLPRFADDEVAGSPEGAALAVADRVDTLAACFGIGLVPKGGDPQGLRRATLGVLRTLDEHGLAVDLRDLFGAAVDEVHAMALAAEAEGDGVRFDRWLERRGKAAVCADRSALVAELVEFTLARIKAAAVADGASADLVDAVLAVLPAPDPLDVGARLTALRGLAGTEEFEVLATLFKRVRNILDKNGVADVESAYDASGLVPAAAALHAAIDAVSARWEVARAGRDYAGMLAAAASLREPVAKFFDDVLVDDPNPEVRGRRLGLLSRVQGLVRDVADFSRITTR